ncbi:MAG: hypothetical protein U0872_04165 [Planctomycetaceae bacterium]
MSSPSRILGRCLCLLALISCLACTGCSLLVMSQRLILGDDLIQSEFESFTRVDLTKGKYKLLVVCSTPDSVDRELSTLKLELIDGVTRRLRREKIPVIDSDKVANWMDEHGGLPSDPTELAKDFEADYIVWIDVQEFTLKEENSVKLLRGRALGFVHVYRVSELDGERQAMTVFNKEFTATYPPHKPISEVNRSADIFQRDFVHKVCDQLARKFYDYRPGLDF